MKLEENYFIVGRKYRCESNGINNFTCGKEYLALSGEALKGDRGDGTYIFPHVRSNFILVEEEKQQNDKTTKKILLFTIIKNLKKMEINKKLYAKCAIVFAISLMLGSSFYYVEPGYRGTLVTLGKVHKTSFANGIGLKVPFVSSMIKTDVRTKVVSDTAVTYTKDIQSASIQFTLTYNVAPESVPQLYERVGENYYGKLIAPYVQDAIKDVVGVWNAQDLVSNRDKARMQILTALKRKINSKYIQNISFQITNLDYSDNFENAIEKKVVAEQKAQEAANNTKRIQEESKQKVISAEADAKAMEIKATALEKNQRLVDYEAVQKWDGKLPTYMLGNGAMPFVNIK